MDLRFDQVWNGYRGLEQEIWAVRDRAHEADVALRNETQTLAARADGLNTRVLAEFEVRERMQAEAVLLTLQVRQLEAALSEARAETLARLAAVREEAAQAAARERDELNDRALMLEQLLTGTAASRPPGARQAVARLPSPAVAVIIPTYNRAAFIGEAIASVQAQSFQDWELVVVDDGSTDDTAAVVSGFLDDRRIRSVRQDRAGQSSARNRGIAATRAPLIAYLDSDNLWYPDYLARMVDCLATETETDVAYGALASDRHGLDRRNILWRRFDRKALLQANYIDTNVMVHRRTLVERLGGWDPLLHKLEDWDLVLRYTADKPARALSVVAARYRDCDGARITDVVPVGPPVVSVGRRWSPPYAGMRRPRVLYAVTHYPQLSAQEVETELRCMLAWGVHVEVWRKAAGASPYPVNVPVHDGSFADAVAAVRPDVIHVHLSGFDDGFRYDLGATGRPVTLRLHAADVTRANLLAWLAHDWVAGIYGDPDRIVLADTHDVRALPTRTAFDSRLFKPVSDKDSRLVVRTSAALPGRDLESFIALAKRLPEYRFVLAAATCNGREAFVEHLKAVRESAASPVELVFDLPHEDVAALVGHAALYVHTAPPETPVGQPLSVIEAMATGCYCLVRDLPDLAALVKGVGATYRDEDELVAAVRATEDRGDVERMALWKSAIDRAYQLHADIVVLRALFDDWTKLSAREKVPA